MIATREMVITRVFDAPRALVFAAWTDPAHMSEWWGPKGFTIPVCELGRAAWWRDADSYAWA